MRTKWIILASMGIAGSALAAPKVPDVGSEEFGELVEVIKPSGAELKWLEIDWGTDFWGARQRAASEGKPIFLWEMDGHPMACT